jgi:hypothetical protein
VAGLPQAVLYPEKSKNIERQNVEKQAVDMKI